MTPEQYLTFIILRQSGRIGKIWPVPGGYLVGNMDTPYELQYHSAEFYCYEKFWDLLDQLSGVPKIKKRDIGREIREIKEGKRIA